MNSQSTRIPVRTTTRAACIVLFALIATACGGDAEEDGGGGAVANPTAAPTEAATDPADTGVGDAEPTPVVDIVENDSDPVSGGTLRVGLEADVDGLNPTSSALSAPGLTMANAVFETLTDFDVDGNPVPHLAASVESVDGDLTKWRLVLRDGIEFHDGTPLDAEAVRVNYETQIADPLLGIATRPFVPEDGAITVIDERTVEYRLLEPSAVFPATLATQLGMVASPTWLAAALENPVLNQEPVGTGPFRYESRSQDSLTRVVRNDDWWGGAVYLDAIEFVPVPDPATRGVLLQEGDLDAIHVTDPATIGNLFADDDLQHIIDDAGEEQFVVLNTAAPPFNDIRARQALALATPLGSYRAQIGVGVARGADQMFIPESPFYNPDVVQAGDDSEAAAALVADYCADVPDNCSGGKIDVEYQYAGPGVVATNSAELLAEGWSAAFNVSLEELVQDAHVQQTVFGQFQAALFRGFGQEEPTLSRINLLCRTIGPISINFARYCSEERDTLLLETQATVDLDARAGLWQEIVRSMNESYAYIFLIHIVWDTSFGPEVRGICDRTSPDGTPLVCVSNGRMWFHTVWLDE